MSGKVSPILLTPFGEMNLVKRKDHPGQKQMSVGQDGVVVP